MSLLEVSDLVVRFELADHGWRKRSLCAVGGVSFTLERGEWLGLVGESGCGKSTLGRALLGLERISGGQVLFNGMDVTSLRGAARRQLHRSAQLIFQDPFTALNPRVAVGDAIAEVLRVHRVVPRDACRQRVAQLLTVVGLDPVFAGRYPHEFSGGQRQRIGIARALALEPALLIADEPVSALDVSVQAQILSLLRDLHRTLQFACLFIAHDLAVVRAMCPRAMVMYLGQVVEAGPTEQLFMAPLHPYTAALVAAVPDIDKALGHGGQPGDVTSAAMLMDGDRPRTGIPFAGCPFRPRCPRAATRCRNEAPALRNAGPGRAYACHL